MSAAVPRELADYLELLSKAVFTPGLSWRLVEAKWDGIREALHGFDPPAIAGLTPPEIDALMQDRRMIRNRRKIEATVENARQLIALEREHGGFADYLRAHASPEVAVRDLRRRFRFLGERSALHFLWAAGADVSDEAIACAHGYGPPVVRLAEAP